MFQEVPTCAEVELWKDTLDSKMDNDGGRGDESEDTHCKEILKAPLHRFEPGTGENHQVKEVYIV